MILSDRSIKNAMREEGLVIRPFLPERLQPASYDLTLGDEIIIPGKGDGRRISVAMSYELRPYRFILGSTAEWIEIPTHLVGILVGKSSLARRGIQIESAGYVDPGWRGHLTMEIVNFNEETVSLLAGMKIAQIRFERMTTPADRPYGTLDLDSHYQDSHGVVPSYGDREAQHTL